MTEKKERNGKGQFIKAERFNTSRKEIEISLQGLEEKAVIVIEKLKQNYPSQNDLVLILGKIKLPAINGRLKEKLQFGARVTVLDNSLHNYWGRKNTTQETKYNTRETTMSAKTWAKGFAKMETYLLEEIHQLETAIEIRAEALRQADY